MEHLDYTDYDACMAYLQNPDLTNEQRALVEEQMQKHRWQLEGFDAINFLKHQPASPKLVVSFNMKSYQVEMHGLDIEVAAHRISELVNLEYCHLESCGLPFTPDFSQMKRLKYLNLTSNALIELAGQIKGLKNLEELYVDDNFFDDEELEKIKATVPKGCEVFVGAQNDFNG
jgi:hypothetical protein